MYQILTLEIALINRPCRSIEDEVKSIGYKQDRGLGIRILEANGDSGDILQHYRRIELLFHQLQASTQLPFFLRSSLTYS